MLKQRTAMKLAAALAVVVLAAAACGSDGSDTDVMSDANTEAVDGNVEDTGELPKADSDLVGDSDGDAAIAGACIEGEPECNDTPVVNPDVLDLPSGDEDAAPTEDPGSASSSGMVVDGGLTISELLAADATGVVAVKGHLFDDGSGMRLCEELVGQGERYGCGDQSVELIGLDLESVAADIIPHNGISYTEGLVTVLGELDGDTLVIDNTSV